MHTAIDWAANTIDIRFKDQPAVRIRLHRLFSFIYSNLLELEKALEHAEKSAELVKQELNPANPEHAKAIRRLFEAYMLLDRHAEAEQIIKRELELAETTFGSEHPNTVLYLDHLAELYTYQRDIDVDFGLLGRGKLTKNTLEGKFDEAEPLYRRSLEIREIALGKEHPDVALSLINLSRFYCSQENYDEAEPLLKRAVKIRKKALGTEHPDEDILAVLAWTYEAQGQYDAAERLLKSALSIREKAYGTDHPAVVEGIIRLAHLYKRTGRI